MQKIPKEHEISDKTIDELTEEGKCWKKKF